MYIEKPIGYIWYLSKNSWVSMQWREIIELQSQLIIVCFYIVEKCIGDTGFSLWRSLGIHRYFLWKNYWVYKVFSCEDSFGVDGFLLWKFIGFSQVFLWQFIGYTVSFLYVSFGFSMMGSKWRKAKSALELNGFRRHRCTSNFDLWFHQFLLPLWAMNRQ